MATYHEDHANWRVIGRGNHWQVQEFVSNECGKSWWDIAPPFETKDEAIALTKLRAR